MNFQFSALECTFRFRTLRSLRNSRSFHASGFRTTLRHFTASGESRKQKLTFSLQFFIPALLPPPRHFQRPPPPPTLQPARLITPLRSTRALRCVRPWRGMLGMFLRSPDLEPGSTAGLENGNHTFNFLAQAEGEEGCSGFY